MFIMIRAGDTTVTVSQEGGTPTVELPTAATPARPKVTARPKAEALAELRAAQPAVKVRAKRPRRKATTASYKAGRAEGKAIRAFADTTPGFSRRDYMTPGGNYFVNKRLRDAFAAHGKAQAAASR